MRRSWQIKLRSDELGAEAPLEMSFTDSRDIFDGWLVFKRVFFDKIIDIIKGEENYMAIPAIMDVNPPSEEMYVLPEQCFIIIATDTQGNPYGLLFVVTASGVVLAGVWPEPLVEVMKEKKELINIILHLLLEKPDIWKEVLVIFVVEEKLRRET